MRAECRSVHVCAHEREKEGKTLGITSKVIPKVNTTLVAW